MYGKFFASTFTGSMYGSGPDVFAVWGYVIANAVDSQVELNPRLLAGVIGTSPERIQAAIAILSSPDPNSRTKDHEGRRLIREGEFAYHVPNFLTYRSIRNEEDRRAYNREKQREHRQRVKASVNDSQSLSTLSAQAETEAEAKAEITSSSRGDLLEVFLPHPDHHNAYLAIRGSAANRVSFDAMLRSLRAPLSGGAAYEWVIIGQALLEIHSTGGKATPNSIRAFCRKLTAPEPPALGRKGGATGDGIDWTQHISETP